MVNLGTLDHIITLLTHISMYCATSASLIALTHAIAQARSPYREADLTSISLVRVLIFLIIIAMLQLLSFSSGAMLSALMMICIYWIGLIGVRRRHSCALATFVTLSTIVVTLMLASILLYTTFGIMYVVSHRGDHQHALGAAPEPVQMELPQAPLKLQFPESVDTDDASPWHDVDESATPLVKLETAAASKLLKLQRPAVAWNAHLKLPQLSEDGATEPLVKLQSAGDANAEEPLTKLESSADSWVRHVHAVLNSFKGNAMVDSMLVKLEQAQSGGDADEAQPLVLRRARPIATMMDSHMKETIRKLGSVDYAILALYLCVTLIVIVMKIRAIVLALRLMRQLRKAEIAAAAVRLVARRDASSSSSSSAPTKVNFSASMPSNAAAKNPVGSHIPRVYYPNSLPQNVRNV